MKRKIIYALFILITLNASAQKNLELMVKKVGDTAYVRWSELDYFNWRSGMENGYIIKTTTFDSLVQGTAKWKTLNPQVKPLSLENFKQKYELNYNAAVAAQMIYGKVTQFEGEDFISNQYKEQNNRFTIFTLATSKDIKLAADAGVGFIDVNPYKNAVYKVVRLGTDTVSVINGIDPLGNELLLPPVFIENQEKAVEIRIENSVPEYWGYYIEKRKKGTKQFNKISNAPFVNLDNLPDSVFQKPMIIHTDSLAENYEVF